MAEGDSSGLLEKELVCAVSPKTYTASIGGFHMKLMPQHRYALTFSTNL